MDQGFIEGYEDLILELREIRKANDVSKHGNQIRRAMCPLGINTVRLTEVKLKNSKGLLFIQLEYQPNDRIILGKKEKIAPITMSVFQHDEVGKLYGHVFKPKPKEMPQLEYMQHVCRRMVTWIDIPVQVAIIYDKGIMRDSYGKMETDGVGRYQHLRLAYYPRIVFDSSFSWDTAIQMSPKDKRDYEQWYKEKNEQEKNR